MVLKTLYDQMSCDCPPLAIRRMLWGAGVSWDSKELKQCLAIYSLINISQFSRKYLPILKNTDDQSFLLKKDLVKEMIKWGDLKNWNSFEHYLHRMGDTEKERYEEKRAVGFFYLEGGGFGYFFRYLHNSLGA